MPFPAEPPQPRPPRDILAARVELRGKLAARPDLSRCSWCASLDGETTTTLWSIYETPTGPICTGALVVGVARESFHAHGEFFTLSLPQ